MDDNVGFRYQRGRVSVHAQHRPGGAWNPVERAIKITAEATEEASRLSSVYCTHLHFLAYRTALWFRHDASGWRRSSSIQIYYCLARATHPDSTVADWDV